MTRKNVSTGIVEAFSDLCPECEGRGILLHDVD
jgi:ribonuclease E